MDYTARFTEQAELLANDVVVASAVENNTGYVLATRFHRLAVIITPVTLGGDIDVDVEQATDAAGTGAKTLDAGGKDTTIQAADTAPTVIEIRGEEFDVDGGFDAINIETTPAGASTYVVQIWGIVPRHMAVNTTNLDSVVD